MRCRAIVGLIGVAAACGGKPAPVPAPARPLLRITTFGADPPEARAAYAEALALRWAGRMDAYRAALEAIEAAHPSSLLARRARRWRSGSRYLDAASAAFAMMFAGLLLPAWID